MRLSPGEVHVWSAALTTLEHRLGSYETWLDQAEKMQAERYHFGRDRRRYAACRGWLRGLCGDYLGIPPERLVYLKGKSGKPRLASPWESLRFNLSHSGEKVLLAFTLDRELGIDLERLRGDVATEPIAQACFSPRDLALLAGAGDQGKTSTFFRLWTRLEAGLKLRGGGLALWQQDLARASGQGDLQEPSIYELNTQPGYAAALAVGPVENGCAGSREPIIRCFQI